MGVRERAVDRGATRGRRLVIDIGRELRIARRDRGVSQATVGAAVGCTGPEISRIERGLVLGVGLDTLARIAACVGLDLAAKCYAGGSPLREAGHARELALFREQIHPLLRWRTEVPVGDPGDQRTWDGMVEGVGWRTGVECEMSPTDWQALERRLELKHRDSGVDFVILLLPETRHVRAILRATHAEGSERFPVPGRTALARLRSGSPPGGSSIVVLRRRNAEGDARDARTAATAPDSAAEHARDAHSNAEALDRAQQARPGVVQPGPSSVRAPHAQRPTRRPGSPGSAEKR